MISKLEKGCSTATKHPLYHLNFPKRYTSALHWSSIRKYVIYEFSSWVEPFHVGNGVNLSMSWLVCVCASTREGKKQQHQQIMDRQQELLRLLLLVVYQGWNAVQNSSNARRWLMHNSTVFFQRLIIFGSLQSLGTWGQGKGKHRAIFEINLTLRLLEKVRLLSDLLYVALQAPYSNRTRKYLVIYVG